MARSLTTRTLSTITKQITATVSRRYKSEIPFNRPPGFKEITYEWIPNHSMKRGPKNFAGFWKTEQGIFGWTLLPGVPKENVSIKVMGHVITYSGNEDPYFPDLPADLVRSYENKICVNPNEVDASRVKSELVNGVLWMHVPTVSSA